MQIPPEVYAIISTPIVTFALVVFAGFLSSKAGFFLINRIIRKLTERTKTTLDDEILAALATPLQVAISAAGVYTALKITEELSTYNALIDKLGFVAIIFFSSWILSRLVGAVFRWYGTKLAEKSTDQGFLSKQILPFSARIASVVLYAIGAMIILSHLGVQIAPLLGSLGIAGLAVALALQDTLSNFFAGLYFLFDKPVRVGDFVTLEEGSPKLEGFVEEIGWRNTKIAMLNNAVVIIPNAKLAQSTFENRTLKGKTFAGTIRVTVSYGADLEQVEKLLLEAANRVLSSHQFAAKDARASVNVTDFGEFDVALGVVYYASEYVKRMPLESAIRKEIFRVFRENGIETPFPTRVIINKKP